jgi:hypothetical protein
LLKHKTRYHFVIFYYFIESGTFLLAMEVTHLYAFRFHLLGCAEKGKLKERYTQATIFLYNKTN